MSKRFGYSGSSSSSKNITTYGGPNDKGCFRYGGPQQQKRVFNGKPKTLELLTKSRLLSEKRIYINNSNSKWIGIGLVPASKLHDEANQGFYVEACLCGDKSPAVPLGGFGGIGALFATIRKLPDFTQVKPVMNSFESDDNIQISSTNMDGNVYKFENLNVAKKCIFLADSSIYELLEHEMAIMELAKSFNPVETEEVFNNLVDEAIADFSTFSAEKWVNPTSLEIDMFSNFAEFFEYVVDKKKDDEAKNNGAEDEIPAKKMRNE